jgi:hypothetical protein
MAFHRSRSSVLQQPHRTQKPDVSDHTEPVEPPSAVEAVEAVEPVEAVGGPDAVEHVAPAVPRHQPAPSDQEPAAQPSGHTGDASVVEMVTPLSEPVRPVAARAWWTVVGITLLFWAFQLFGYVDTSPWLSLMVVLLGSWGLATVAVSWMAHISRPKLAGVLAWLTLGVTVAALVAWSYQQIVVAPAYGTDEIAFDQYAAQLLVHGLNPYVHSMSPAFTAFHVSPDGYTFTLNGHPVTTLSYPALSFLLYAPFLLVGWSSQMAIVVNVIAWALGIVLVFALLPRSVRPLSMVVGSLGVYIGYAVGGVTDALFLPFLIGAVYQWDRFPAKRGLAAWRGPVLLGLAMAVKQTPWLLLPFLVAGVGLEARRMGEPGGGWRSAGRYLMLAVGAFLVPNLPFIALAPHQWLSGVSTPIISHAVPAGQGVVGLSLFLGLGGGSLTAYSVALAVVLLALFALFLATFPSSKLWAALCPAVVLFFAGRSYGSYLVTLLPAAAVAAFTVSVRKTSASATASARARAGGRPLWWRHWRWVAAGGLFATAVAVVVAIGTSPPLSVHITSVRTTGQLATVDQVGVKVVNRSGSREQPSFTVESGGVLTAFWSARGGPRTLPPHSSAHYTLYSPNFFAQPALTGGFQVVAFTSDPGTVSPSGAYVPTLWHVSLAPDAVNHLEPIDHTITVRADVLDNLNRPIDQAGIPVYMGQVIYAQQGLEYGEAVINGSQVGQTPVVAYTNRSGVATFRITGTQSSLTPVYFEANLVSSTQYYPYGYSEILPVRFDG